MSAGLLQATATISTAPTARSSSSEGSLQTPVVVSMCLSAHLKKFVAFKTKPRPVSLACAEFKGSSKAHFATVLK